MKKTVKYRFQAKESRDYGIAQGVPRFVHLPYRNVIDTEHKRGERVRDLTSVILTKLILVISTIGSITLLV